MNIKSIYTKRTYEKKTFWDLVYEWEDILAKELNANIINEPKAFDKSLKGIPGLYKWMTKGDLSLCFQMGAEIVPDRIKPLQELLGLRAKNISDVIPCIIDFWQPENDIRAMERAYSNNKVVLVTSMEAIEFLNKHNVDINYKHWPLSLPNQYSLDNAPSCGYEKKYDLALMGRQCVLMSNFLKEYIEKHPNFTYVTSKRENGHFNYYTNNGEFVGCADDRKGYFDIMRSAKIGLYSTPGVDNKSGSNGYNQVTPRFLELLSAQCHIIAHYPVNADTDFYNLSDFSEDINTYEKFEKAMNIALEEPVDMKKYREYLSHHYTTVRANQLELIVDNL